MSEKKFVTLELLNATPELAREDVFVEELKAWVHVVEMDAGTHDWLDSSMVADVGTALVTVSDKKGNKMALDNFRVKIVAASLADKETGERLFTLDQLRSGEAVKIVGSKSSRAIGTIAEVVIKLNHLNEEDVKKLGEDLGRDQVDSSVSVSPENLDVPSENSTDDSQEQSS